MKLNMTLQKCRCLAQVAVAAAFGPLGSAAAQVPLPNGTHSLTLVEAVSLALANNPDIHASGARVEVSAWQAYQARKWTNPELGLSAEDWPVSNGGGFSQAKQTIGIAQTLPYPGKKSLDKQIGGAGVKVSEAELDLRRTEIARDVKASFFRVLASERLIEVSTQLVAVAESSAATARKRVDAGAAAYQEQLRAELQFEQARTELGNYERDLATARQTFATLLGRPDLKNACLLGNLAEAPDQALVEAVSGRTLARHPSARTAQASLEQAQLRYRRARLEPYPDVKIGVSGGRIGETDQSIIQVGFSVPLPIIDTGKGRTREAHANMMAAEGELHGVQLQLQRELFNAQERYRAAVEQVGSYRERILPKATEALRLVKTGFEEGKFGLIDLLDTQRTAAEVRRSYQEKLLEMNVAQTELEALLKPELTRPSTAK